MPDEGRKTPTASQDPEANPEEQWVEDSADDAGEWVDEAQETEWVEDTATAKVAKGPGKPKELPAYTSWLAGLAGLLLGLLAFRSCG